MDRGLTDPPPYFFKKWPEGGGGSVRSISTDLSFCVQKKSKKAKFENFDTIIII